MTKRILSLCLVLAMVLSLVPVIGTPKVSAATTQTVKIYFKNTDGWSKVNGYVWTSDNTPQMGQWPGTALSMGSNGLYELTVNYTTGTGLNFIFNNGSGTQTADLWTDADVCYGWEVDKAVLIDCEGTDVEDIVIEQPTLDITRPMYNILGQKVGTTYHGIVIHNGEKMLLP